MGNKKSQVPLLFHGDSFDIDFASYIFSDDSIMIKFQETVRSKKFTASSTDIKYRVLNHWEEMGLLPDKLRKQKDGWRRFSLVEFVWCKILGSATINPIPVPPKQLYICPAEN